LDTDPAQTDAISKRNGLPIPERIRLLRSQFRFSLAEAKAVVDQTDGRPPLFPKIGDSQQLKAVLEAELGFCNCASGAAMEVLRNIMRLTQQRTDATNDSVAFARISRELEALIAEGGGWAEWMVYGLEQRDFLGHGFRITDLLITDKGRLFLQAIEQFDPA